jgi:hypothetical protein
MFYDCEEKVKPQLLLTGLAGCCCEPPKKEVRDYVVMVAEVIDTAIIPATSEREAAELYEFAPGSENADLAVWAMTREEFGELIAMSKECEAEK